MAALKQTLPPLHVEAIAAEVEKLLGQKSIKAARSMGYGGLQPPSHTKSSQNAISGFLHSVLQLQQAMPGFNVMQLLQALLGTQQQMPTTHDFMDGLQAHSTSAQGADLAATLMQMQLQLNLQNQFQNMQVSPIILSYY
jgi:hypothetical protein